MLLKRKPGEGSERRGRATFRKAGLTGRGPVPDGAEASGATKPWTVLQDLAITHV